MLAMPGVDTENLLKSAIEYLDRLLGTTVHVDINPENKMTARLPVYLDRAYPISLWQPAGKSNCTGDCAGRRRHSVAGMKKDAKAIAGVLDAPVVFLLEKLASYERTRLVQEKVAFLVPGKQLYIPFLVINPDGYSSDIAVAENKKAKTGEPGDLCSLPPRSKNRVDSDIIFRRSPKRQRYSAMTVKRAAEELQEYELARRQGSYEKFIYFVAQGRDLWEKARAYLASPEKTSFYIEELPSGVELKGAGLAATERIPTDLARGREQVYAIANRSRKAFEKKVPASSIDYFGGNIEIQVWYYDPAVLSNTGAVDPLSLYLSLPSYQLDERTQQAKEDLLNKYVW